MFKEGVKWVLFVFAKINPMKNFLKEALYHSDGELWILPFENHYKVGVTEFGQEFFRDIKKIEFPEIGRFYSKEDPMAFIETDKVDTELFFPLSGKVEEINSKLLEIPSLINSSPFEQGWILKLTDVPSEEIKSLMNAEAYQEFLNTFFNK